MMPAELKMPLAIIVILTVAGFTIWSYLSD